MTAPTAFLERPSDVSIIYATSGPNIKSTIVEGDWVTLRLPDTDVLVRDLIRYRIGTSEGFRGILVRFGSNPWQEHAGYVVGQPVVFSEEQVFVCEVPR